MQVDLSVSPKLLAHLTALETDVSTVWTGALTDFKLGLDGMVTYGGMPVYLLAKSILMGNIIAPTLETRAYQWRNLLFVQRLAWACTRPRASCTRSTGQWTGLKPPRDGETPFIVGPSRIPV